MIDRKTAENAFYTYTSHYDPDNSMIRHKIAHTLRVADNCERISQSLCLETELVEHAWFIGLLHDIGRFEQVRRYQTFIDSVSVDHAEFGADLLFKENLIREFPIKDLTAELLSILETAIRLHNKLNLPEELDERT
ncbi:MAG: HD domain-containing protein, partial [Lachnospiraceae bacterium]|nr:HD domain-containing protein [Lachnospiraceae bacterium]